MVVTCIVRIWVKVQEFVKTLAQPTLPFRTCCTAFHLSSDILLSHTPCNLGNLMIFRNRFLLCKVRPVEEKRVRLFCYKALNELIKYWRTISSFGNFSCTVPAPAFFSILCLSCSSYSFKVRVLISSSLKPSNFLYCSH